MICIATGLGQMGEFMDGPISDVPNNWEVPSGWDGLEESGVIICRGNWKSIAKYIADKQPMSYPSPGERGGVR